MHSRTSPQSISPYNKSVSHICRRKKYCICIIYGINVIIIKIASQSNHIIISCIGLLWVVLTQSLNNPGDANIPFSHVHLLNAMNCRPQMLQDMTSHCATHLGSIRILLRRIELEWQSMSTKAKHHLHIQTEPDKTTTDNLFY